MALIPKLKNTIGRNYGVGEDDMLTKGALLGTAHREGTGNVVKYLDHLKRHNWMSKPNTFPEGELGEKFLHIETRLRTFQPAFPR